MTAERMIGNGELTRMAILALVGQRGPTSRADMARELDLSGATVTKITRQLIERGILEPLSFEPSEGGRPGQLLGLVATAGHAIGVKVAADHLAIVEVQLDGRIVGSQTRPFDALAADAVTRLAADIREVIADRGSSLLGVGVGVPGIVNRPDSGIVSADVLGWEDKSVGPELRAELNTPVLVENDVKALAVAESLYGRGRGKNNFVVLTIGSGVGFASVSEGVVSRGASGGAGEIAHVVLNPRGPVCPCGNRGCLETFVGSAGLISAGRLAGLLEDDEGVVRLVELADQFDRGAQEILGNAAKKLGQYAAAPIAALDPELIVIAGEGTFAWRHWERAFTSSLRRHLPRPMRSIAVEVDSWDDSSWARGAAAIVLATPFDQNAAGGRQTPKVLERLHGTPVRGEV